MDEIISQPARDPGCRFPHPFRRRTVLAGLGFGAAATFGCVPVGAGAAPELVWGRRGFSDGRFLKPRAIAVDQQDRLYIVDTTGRIQVFDADGTFIRGWRTPETANGRPTGLAVMPSPPSKKQPRLLVADTHYYRVLAFCLDGQLRDDEQIGGQAGYQPGEFAFVTDVACDRRGCYYVGEYGDSDRIQKFDPDGNFLAQWGGTGRTAGKFVRPQGLVVHEDRLFVADAGNHRIQLFDLDYPTPKRIGVWGREGKGKGEFYYPYGLAAASDGSIVVCEYGNQRLQRLSADGKWIAFWGGPGVEPGQLHEPWGVVIDSQDRVHVLDSNNHRVQRLGLPS